MLFPDVEYDNYYNRRFLDKTGKDFVAGFDHASEQAENLAYHFDNYSEFLGDELSAVLGKPENVAKLAEVIKNWMRTSRNETVTWMIDGMDEDVFAANRQKELEFAEESGVSLYDTRKMFTADTVRNSDENDF